MEWPHRETSGSVRRQREGAKCEQELLLWLPQQAMDEAR